MKPAAAYDVAFTTPGEYIPEEFTAAPLTIIAEVLTTVAPTLTLIGVRVVVFVVLAIKKLLIV